MEVKVRLTALPVVLSLVISEVNSVLKQKQPEAAGARKAAGLRQRELIYCRSTPEGAGLREGTLKSLG